MRSRSSLPDGGASPTVSFRSGTNQGRLCVRHSFRSTEGDIKENAREKIALSLAQAAAIDYGTSINEIEMKLLIDNLFMCETPNYSPGGKNIIQIISMEEIDKKF